MAVRFRKTGFGMKFYEDSNERKYYITLFFEVAKTIEIK